MIAKKSIDTGEDCDSVPESMRQLLAMQGLESVKPFARQMLGRAGGPMAQYGNGGMLMNGDPNGSGKVGTSNSTLLPPGVLTLTHGSHSPFHMSFFKHRLLASSRPKRHGSCHLLFAR